MKKRLRLTIVHPCIGRRIGQRYMRTWQMEPLPAAVLAALTPDNVDIKLYDDRMEPIPYDEPTDLVALSVETYTAKRAYQIASEYRRRGVPVIMGGFHASLVPDEVARYAESVVVGEVEGGLWERVLDDYQSGTPAKVYRQDQRPTLGGFFPKRDLYRDRKYLPVRLVEVGRGCEFRCEFCAIQTVFNSSYRRRPLDEIVRELTELSRTDKNKLFFFVDDNFIAHPKEAKEVLEAIAPLGLRWVSQASINLAHDEELLSLVAKSGCAGLLIGFESLEEKNLEQMGKRFNTMKGGFEVALANLARHKIRLYGTFLFGYDHDTAETVRRTVAFAKEHALYIAAFNHATPFPGTALYKRLEKEGRFLYDKWWLDENYSYAKVPFQPTSISADDLHKACVAARKSFYSIPSILQRGMAAHNRADSAMFKAFFPINLMHTFEVKKRVHHPLGDVSFQGPLLEATR